MVVVVVDMIHSIVVDIVAVVVLVVAQKLFSVVALELVNMLKSVGTVVAVVVESVVL